MSPILHLSLLRADEPSEANHEVDRYVDGDDVEFIVPRAQKGVDYATTHANKQGVGAVQILHPTGNGLSHGRCDCRKYSSICLGKIPIPIEGRTIPMGRSMASMRRKASAKAFV